METCQQFETVKIRHCSDMELFEFEPHMSLEGKTPAEKCGIEIEVDNKWLTLIQNAKKDELV